MLRLSAMGFLPLFILSPIKQHPDICSTGANLQSQHKPPSPPAVQHKQVFLSAALHVLAVPAAGKHAHIAAFPPSHTKWYFLPCNQIRLLPTLPQCCYQSQLQGHRPEKHKWLWVTGYHEGMLPWKWKFRNTAHSHCLSFSHTEAKQKNTQPWLPTGLLSV